MRNKISDIQVSCDHFIPTNPQKPHPGNTAQGKAFSIENVNDSNIYNKKLCSKKQIRCMR